MRRRVQEEQPSDVTMVVGLILLMFSKPRAYGMRYGILVAATPGEDYNGR